jgi:hypothetical protein
MQMSEREIDHGNRPSSPVPKVEHEVEQVQTPLPLKEDDDS